MLGIDGVTAPRRHLCARVAAGVGAVPAWDFGMPVVFSVTVGLGALLGATVMGAGFGLVPAIRAARLSPVEALASTWQPYLSPGFRNLRSALAVVTGFRARAVMMSLGGLPGAGSRDVASRRWQPHRPPRMLTVMPPVIAAAPSR